MKQLLFLALCFFAVPVVAYADPDSPPNQPTLHVLIDTLPISDIQGGAHGVYADANRVLSEGIGNDVKTIFGRKTRNITLSTSSGLTLDVESKLFYAQQDKRTEAPFSRTFSANTPPAWTSEKGVALIQDLLAKGIKNGGDPASYAAWLPEDFKHDADYLLWIQASSIDVPMWKSLGIAFAVGGVFAPDSKCTARVALIDVKTDNVVWFMQRKGNRGIEDLQTVVHKILRVLARGEVLGKDVNETPIHTAEAAAGDGAFAIISNYDAKLAYRAGRMTKDEFKQLVEQNENKLDQIKLVLRDKRSREELSHAAFDASVTRASLEYIGP